MRSDLERLFSPQSIAVIGASQDLITISGQPLSHLVNHGYAGKLYPVNPRYPEILGASATRRWPTCRRHPTLR
jgi:Acyl-CoA synthetase (NDP forming)